MEDECLLTDDSLSFNLLETCLREQFPNFVTIVKNGFILCSPRDNDPLTYIPTFHCVISESGHEFTEVQLIAFNGKVLKSERVAIKPQIESNYLALLHTNTLSLCQGLSDQKLAEHGVIREYLRDRIISRSENCRYAIFDKKIRCTSCSEFESEFSENFEVIPDLQMHNYNEEDEHNENVENNDEIID